MHFLLTFCVADLHTLLDFKHVSCTFLIVVAVCFPQRALENSRFWRVAENAEAGLEIDATSHHIHCSVGDASQLPNAPPRHLPDAQCKRFGLPPGKSVLDTEGTKQRMEK